MSEEKNSDQEFGIILDSMFNGALSEMNPSKESF